MRGICVSGGWWIDVVGVHGSDRVDEGVRMCVCAHTEDEKEVEDDYEDVRVAQMNKIFAAPTQFDEPPQLSDLSHHSAREIVAEVPPPLSCTHTLSIADVLCLAAQPRLHEQPPRRQEREYSDEAGPADPEEAGERCCDVIWWPDTSPRPEHVSGGRSPASTLTPSCNERGFAGSSIRPFATS